MDASERRRLASAAAAEWWLRLRTSEMSRAERQEFVGWLRESAVHVAEMLRIAQVHNALEQFDRWTKISIDGPDDENVLEFPGHPSEPSLHAPSRLMARAALPAGSEGGHRYRPATKWMGALAAGLLFVAVAAGLMLWSLAGQTIETVRGERREVALADGSVLQVDPETRLRVKLEEHARKVVLERGRALFRVAKDSTRPFTVQANDTIIRAVGTAFAVDRRTAAVTVTVAEGKVAIIPKSDYREGAAEAIPHEWILPAASPSAESGSAVTVSNKAGDSAPLLLTASEQVTVTMPAAPEAVRKIDTDRELAWTQGRLIFDNVTLETAVTEFNRYNRVQLRITDAALVKRTVSGIFDASDPESFIAFIQTVANVRIDRDSDQEITITSTDS